MCIRDRPIVLLSYNWDPKNSRILSFFFVYIDNTEIDEIVDEIRDVLTLEKFAP